MGTSGEIRLMLNVRTTSGSDRLLGNQELGAAGESPKSFGLLEQNFLMKIFSFPSLEEQFLVSCSIRTRINIRCPALSGTGYLLSSGTWFCPTTRAWSLSRFSATDRVNSCNSFSFGAGQYSLLCEVLPFLGLLLLSVDAFYLISNQHSS